LKIGLLVQKLNEATHIPHESMPDVREKIWLKIV